MATAGERGWFPAADRRKRIVVVAAMAQDTVVLEKHMFGHTEEAGYTARATGTRLAQGHQESVAALGPVDTEEKAT
jgi:hypothetical protein